MFDRDPLLIPQLFVDMTPPWHTRARWRVAIVVALGIVTTMGVLVAQQGPRGAIGTVGRAGVAVMHAYTRLVAGYTPADPPPPRSR